MAQVKINKNSILNFSTLLEYEGVLFWDQVDYPEIPLSVDDTYIQVNQIQAQRIDLIAYDFYGTSDLMWAIMLANDLDMPNEILEGMTLRIPALSTVNDLLRQAGKQF